jgi:hypothetical protein
MSTERVDVWMDIAQALRTIGKEVEDDPLMLLSLYTFITQAKATDVSQTFDVNYKTLAKRRPGGADDRRLRTRHGNCGCRVRLVSASGSATRFARRGRHG